MLVLLLLFLKFLHEIDRFLQDLVLFLFLEIRVVGLFLGEVLHLLNHFVPFFYLLLLNILEVLLVELLDFEVLLLELGGRGVLRGV